MKQSYLNQLEEKFYPVNNDNYFGYLRNELTDLNIPKMIEESRNQCTVDGNTSQGYFIKRLKPEELEQRVPLRFENSLSLDRCFTGNGYRKMFPIPRGLIYPGKPTDLFLDNPSAYLISENIKGKRLFHILDKLNDEEKLKLSFLMNIKLGNMQNKGVYLMDFAPRDIVTRKTKDSDFDPIFVDTEHLVCGCKNDEELIDGQRKQFKKDYEGYLGDEYDKFEKRVFMRF